MPVSLFMFTDHLLSHFHSEVIHANDTSRERNQRPETSKYGSTQVLSLNYLGCFLKKSKS